MQRQDFDFELPPDLIAQDPASARDGSLLLDVPTFGPFRIDHFPSIVEQFRGDEVLVVNDTKVVPARVWARRPQVDVWRCSLSRHSIIKPSTP